MCGTESLGSKFSHEPEEQLSISFHGMFPFELGARSRTRTGLRFTKDERFPGLCTRHKDAIPENLFPLIIKANNRTRTSPLLWRWKVNIASAVKMRAEIFFCQSAEIARRRFFVFRELGKQVEVVFMGFLLTCFFESHSSFSSASRSRRGRSC